MRGSVVFVFIYLVAQFVFFGVSFVVAPAAVVGGVCCCFCHCHLGTTPRAQTTYEPRVTVMSKLRGTKETVC